MIAVVSCERQALEVSSRACLSCEHHGVPVNDMTIFHKGGGDQSPGFRQNMLSVYDSLRQTGLRNETCFERLGFGTHHFAAVGYDPLLRDSVIGELTLVVTARTGNVDLILQVSERH